MKVAIAVAYALLSLQPALALLQRDVDNAGFHENSLHRDDTIQNAALEIFSEDQEDVLAFEKAAPTYADALTTPWLTDKQKINVVAYDRPAYLDVFGHQAWLREHLAFPDRIQRATQRVLESRCCIACLKPLRAVGRSRRNGRDHDDWEERVLHKTCYVARKRATE